MTNAKVRQVRATAQLLAIEYPEYWVAVLSCAAWVALIGLSVQARTVGVLCPDHGEISAQMASGLNKAVESSKHWLLMLGAMMLPPVLNVLRGAARRSLWSRRQRTVALVLLGYLVPWAACGVLLELGWRFATAMATRSLISVALLIAAAWQLTPAKKWGLYGCHAEALLVPSGWRADWSCLRFGGMLAARCCISCWLLMLTCTASGHALWLTVLVTGIVWTERMRPRTSREWMSLVLCAAAAAVWFGPVIAA